MTRTSSIAFVFTTFQLTSSQGGWQVEVFFFPPFATFQLTSSQGGWPFRIVTYLYSIVFSTHILTRRMTMNVATDDVSENFSTHILTRRMTICIVVDELISTFQLTSSQGGWPRTESICSIRKFFNSHPHKEDDFWTSFYPVQLRFFNSHPHKEDDYVWVLLPYMIVFSTHILTRRMTLSGLWDIRLFYFQLTSSQGGWRWLS